MASDTFIVSDVVGIKHYEGFTGALVETISTPGSDPWGLTSDGINLYSGDNTTRLIYKHVGFTSSIQSSFPYPGDMVFLSALTWDGVNLISTDPVGGTRKYDAGGTVIATTGWLHKIAWRTEGLLSSQPFGVNPIYRHVGFTSTIAQTINLNATVGVGGVIRAVVWDGTDFYVFRNTAVGYRLAGFSSTILEGPINFTGSGFTRDAVLIIPELFTVTLQYRNAGLSFVNVGTSVGDTGAGIRTGLRTAYWTNPESDRPTTEITDEQVKVRAIPDASNLATHPTSVTSVVQLDASDGTGAQGDVKIQYTIS